VTTLDINSSSTDANSESYYTGTAIGGHFFNNTLTGFHTPDSTYTGFATNGYFYTLGVLDNTRRASWSLEGASSNRVASVRNDQDSFPDSVFIFYSETEVSIVDSVSLEVWMRIPLSGLPSMGTAKIIKAVYCAGILCVIAQQQDGDDTSGILLTYNFRYDCISFAINGTYYLRKHIWNRTDTESYGSLTDTNANYPETSTGTALDFTFTVTDSFPLGQLYDLDLGYVGNQVRGLIGGLGFFTGLDLEARTVDTDFKAPQFKEHSQSLSLTISAANFSITDVTQESSGLTTEWIMYDPTNNLYSSGVSFGDVIKASGSGDTAYFFLKEDPSSGQVSYRVSTVNTQEDFEGVSVDLPGWKNGSQSYLDVATNIQAQNSYEVLRPVKFVRVLDDGSYVISSGISKVCKTSLASIIDTSNSVTEFSLFTQTGSTLTGYSSKQLSEFTGLASNLEELYVVFDTEILKVVVDKITSGDPATSHMTISKASTSISDALGLSAFGEGIAIDPLSGNIFTGGLKSTDRKSYIVEVSPQGVILSCTVFKDPGSGSAETPIIMDGYNNPLGTEV